MTGPQKPNLKGGTASQKGEFANNEVHQLHFWRRDPLMHEYR